MNDLMEIGKFATASGLSVDALRHYDEVGVVKPEQLGVCSVVSFEFEGGKAGGDKIDKFGAGVGGWGGGEETFGGEETRGDAGGLGEERGPDLREVRESRSSVTRPSRRRSVEPSDV